VCIFELTSRLGIAPPFEDTNRSASNGRREIVITSIHFPKGLDGRRRDQDGEIRRKRRDTLVGTLRNEYGEHVAPGYRANTQLGTVLEKEGLGSLDQLLKKKKR
jgi:hypothetical protein